MTILWLILKIILWILGGLVGCIGLLLLGILFLPIIYEMRGEKRDTWDTLSGNIKINVFYILKIHYDLSRPESMAIKLFGFKLPSKDLSDVEEDQNKTKKSQAHKHINKHINNQTNKQTDKQVDNKTDNQTDKQSKNQSKSQTKNQSNKNHTNEKSDKDEEAESKKNLPLGKMLPDLRALWQDESRKPFIRACKKLLISWWRALKPRSLYFEVVFGLEDPAETGMWLAKIMALYSFYAPFGQVTANFNETMLEGCIEIKGKMRLMKFLYPILGFIWHKEVRMMIKNIMKFGKDDQDGIKTQ